MLKTSVENVNEKCFTFDSFFCERFGSTVEDLKDKEMFFRRVFNDTGKIYRYDLSRFLLFRNKIWLFGDTNECSPVEAGSQISYDYDRICFVLQMTGKVKTLEYKEGCGRYDKGTYDMLQEFLKTGKINKYIEKPGEFNTNVCYLNKTRIDFNNHCCKKFIEGKQFVEVNFLYNNNREKYPV